MSLEKELCEYRDITLELMNKVEEQGNRLFLLKKRDDILDKIKKSNYNSYEIENIIEKLDIREIESKLQKKVVNEINITKNKIKNLKKANNGSHAYITSAYQANYIAGRIYRKY